MIIRALIFLGILATSCVPQAKSESDLPVVSVSILPQQYFIEQLAGKNVKVNVMVPPGASPATYEPTVSQLRQLDQSDLYIKMGYLGFEQSWMNKIRSVNPSMEVISLSDGIDLIEGESLEDHGNSHHHGSIDPHIWMSVRNAKKIATNLAGALMPLLPDDSTEIRIRLTEFLSSLDSLDQKITDILKGTAGKSFMIYHPALSYFAKDYQLDQLSLEWEGKTPSPAHMKSLTDLGREHQISTIFIQAEFDRKNAEILSREIDADIVVIDPLSLDWPGQMVHIAKNLKEQW